MTDQLEGQVSMFDLDSQYGRTFREHSVQEKAKTSKQSSKPSAKSQIPTFQFLFLKAASGTNREPLWEKVTVLPGVPMTLNTGESPSAARESTLSQILQANAPEKYFLSKTACEGILRRAAKRGKELPKMLREALEEVVKIASV